MSRRAGASLELRKDAVVDPHAIISPDLQADILGVRSDGCAVRHY